MLEAIANGTPVVQPEHGAFPELVQATHGGILVPPKDAGALADGLASMRDPQSRLDFAKSGRKHVRDRYSMTVMATRTIEIIEALGNQRH